MAETATLLISPDGQGKTRKSDLIGTILTRGASIGEKFAPKVKEDDFFDDDEDDKVEDDLDEDDFDDDLDDESADDADDDSGFDDEDSDDDEDDDDL